MNYEQLLYGACVSVAVLGFAWLLVKTPKKPQRSRGKYATFVREPQDRMRLVKPDSETHFYTPTDKGAA